MPAHFLLEGQAEMTSTVAQDVVVRVYGVPGPQGSKTQTRWGGLRESSKRVAPWRSEVAFAARQIYKGRSIGTPVAIEIIFYFQRPKHHFSKAKGKEHTLVPSAPKHCTSCSHGDLDKLTRSTMDGLAAKSGGSIICDDSQVVELWCVKRYADETELPGALVRIRTA